MILMIVQAVIRWVYQKAPDAPVWLHLIFYPSCWLLVYLPYVSGWQWYCKYHNVLRQSSGWGWDECGKDEVILWCNQWCNFCHSLTLRIELSPSLVILFPLHVSFILNPFFSHPWSFHSIRPNSKTGSLSWLYRYLHQNPSHQVQSCPVNRVNGHPSLHQVYCLPARKQLFPVNREKQQAYQMTPTLFNWNNCNDSCVEQSIWIHCLLMILTGLRSTGKCP